MKRGLFVVVAIGLGVGMLSGCKRNASAPAISAIEQLEIEIADLKAEEGRAAAIEYMTGLLTDPEHTEQKPQVVDWLLEEYLSEDSIETVQDTYLQLAASDDMIARLGYGKMMQASMSTNTAATISWYEKILSAPVSAEMKVFVWKLRSQECATAGTIAPVAERLEEILGLSPGTDVSVLSAVTQQGLQICDYTGLEVLLAAIETRGGDRDDLTHLRLRVTADILLQQEKVVEAETFLATNGVALGDPDLSSRSAKLLELAIKAGDQAMVSRVVLAALASGNERPKTRHAVVRSWLRASEKAGQWGDFVERIEVALDAGCPGDSLLPAVRSSFHTIMLSPDEALQRSCIAVTERLSAECEFDEGRQQSIKLLLLDGSFYVQDFKRAYAIVEAGVRLYDEEWHATTKEKVGAHLALQEGRKEDAIALFRKHMARVELWDAPVINPENGARMCREAVLGFNEKRLGDIYAGMDSRSEDASAAYARARDWYQKAMVSLESDSIEYKSAAAELAEVPTAE